MVVNLKWKVADAPTGHYRSFSKRGWPSASVKPTGAIAVQLYCEDEYVPKRVREGDHREIKIMVADHRGKEYGWTWRALKQRAATLDEAKKLAEKFLNNHPEVLENDKPKSDEGNSSGEHRAKPVRRRL